MRLILLTALTMVAFAANSVLNRLALVGGDMAAVDFGSIRLAAGATTLAFLCLATGRRMRIGGAGRAVAAGALLLYIYGFSAAYLSLDAGIGALILFGTVQITMFAGALAGGETLPPQRWAGAALAFAGLAWLLWPGAGAPVGAGAGAAMALAGIGWGIYSLAGRGASDPLAETAMNFLLAAPLGIVGGILATGGVGPLSAPGVALAVLSGAVTSGLGYALWYSVLPALPASVAAVAQLTVPVIATAGGVLLLGEMLSLQATLAAGVVLGGVALSVVRRRG